MSRDLRLSLSHRLLLMAMIPAAVIALLIGAMYLIRTTQALDDAVRERGLAIASFLAPAAEYGVISGNHSNLSPLLQAVLAQRDVAAVAVHARDGNRVAVSGHLTLSDRVSLREVAEVGVFASDPSRMAIAAPVRSTPVEIHDVLVTKAGATLESHPIVGWIYVELDTRALAARKHDIILSTLGVVLVGLLLTAVLALRLARSVSRPLMRLAAAVRRMAAGELDVSVPDSASTDELRALETGFNQMAQSIAEAHQTLQARVDEATRQLAHQALHDPLTGLPNRRAFEQALEEVVAGSRRAGDHGVLCFIDLDRFKIVNDTCGHAAGDELLRRISRLLRQRVRAEDMICRIGGDEFALILRSVTAEEAHRLADGLREAISTFRFSWDNRRFAIGASIGLVRIDGELESAADVLVAADLACYGAKKGGRNRVVTHTSGRAGDGNRSNEAAANDAYGTRIPFAQLTLYAQPMVALAPPDPGHWVEILLRVGAAADPAGALNALLARLDAADMSLQLDEWVAQQACEAAARHALENPDPALRFSLNLGRSTLLVGGAYLKRLESLMRLNAIPAQDVVLEFPATLAAQMPDECEGFVRAAHGLGCRVALERLDGTTVGLLQTLKPDFAKISLKQLVDSYGLEAGCNLAQALCGTANALSIGTVATEVEDAMLREALRDYGFDYAQGRVIAQPYPLAA